MNLIRIGRLLLVYGFLVVYVNGIYGKQITHKKRKIGKQLKGNATRGQHTVGAKLKPPRQHLKQYDASCKNTLPHNILRGQFTRFRKIKIQDGKSKLNNYMIAEFKCDEGYAFRKSHPEKMFCSKNKWIGKKPICDKIMLKDTLQGDDANAIYTQLLSFDLKECTSEEKEKCKHLCRLYNGQPTCECFPGFEIDGSNCRDIDECTTNNGGCQHTCINSLGSFTCACPEGFRLSSGGRTCEDINECHLRNGHGPCQDVCENTLGSYKCSCLNLSGTRLSADLHTCSDVNECTEGVSGCSHTCINTHGRAFCTCPSGMELGSDWKTCHDINECEDPQIKAACKFGCVNFIGSYYCKKNSNDTVSDQPVTDNETTKNDDYNEEGDYEDEEYEEEDYDDSENYDDKEAVTEEKNILTEKEGPSTNEKDEEMKEVIEEIDTDIKRTESKTKNREINEVFKEVESTTILPVTPKVELPEKSQGKDEKETKGSDPDTDEYDDYDEANYDDEYEEEKNNQQDVVNKTNILIENEGVENTVEQTITPTLTELPNETSESQIIEKKFVNELNKNEYDSMINSISTSTILVNAGKVTPPASHVVQDETGISKKNITNVETSKKEDNSASTVNSNEVTKYIIENRQDTDYKDVYIENNYENETNKKENDDLLPTDTSFTTNSSEVDFIISETKLNETNDNKGGENYDDDYDDEYYDETTLNPKLGNKEVDIKHEEHSHGSNKETTGLDFQSNTTDIHQIILNQTNFEDDRDKQTTTISSVLIPPETTTNTSNTNYEDKDEYDYEDGDYEEEEYIEQTKENITNGDKAIKCDKGYILRDNGECLDIDECQTALSPCSDGCKNTIGSYHCTCPPGFSLSASDPHSCQDVNECLNSSLCSHICVNEAGSYHCECPSDLTLQNDTCVNLTCSHGQTKINGITQCTCPTGFILGADGRNCEDVDECQLDNVCSHLCQNIIGSYKCLCEAGFQLQNGKTCIDIDECTTTHSCPQLCQNTLGSFQCTCEEGYEYSKEQNTCADINECDNARDLDECSQICINYDGGYECACHPGYKLTEDDATCEDVNECSNNNGNCSEICINVQGSYHCECKLGYILDNDNATCKVLDPCKDDNGGCSHKCVNNNGIAVCKCPEGQVLEGRDCYIYDPCVASNGGCSHVCVNANGAVRCECPNGYELQNKTTCTQINLCTINNGNCSHFCEFVEGHVNCICPDLYELRNKTHCVEINPCVKDNGGCSHICLFKNHELTCSCPQTHELQNGTHCFEKNPCLVENGGCSDFCHFSYGNLTCSCPENFYLEGKNCYQVDLCLTNNGGCSHSCFSNEEGAVECTCPYNFELNEDKKTCSPKDQCLVDNGYCSHICNFSTGVVICLCPEGFKLKNKTFCEEHNPCLMENGGCSDICKNVKGKAECSCPDQYVLKDSMNCVLADPCQDMNGGCSYICRNVNNKVKCHCPENYALNDSKECVPIDPCLAQNGGCSHICKNVNNEAKCSCPDHYNLVNKTTCSRVNPCFINNGGCSHECVHEDNKVFCLCPEGYQLDGKKCVLINPCDKKNGGCSHVCTSISGQIICKCPPGYELINKTCFKINPCLINNGGCSHGCNNVKGQAKCTCPPGYKLFGKACSDEDPCTKNNGGCSHFCHYRNGERQCSCPPGYLLRPNKRICKELNECRVNRGGCSHGCKNLPGSYHCTCPRGFVLDPVDNKTCVDVDECQMNNGNCEMFCRNFKGGFRCECPEGYVIQKDRHSCKLGTVMHCRIPLPPSNGVIKCLDQKTDYGSLVPVGTKCNVWCDEGYKLDGKSQRVCNNSGIWEGEESRCVESTCPSLPPVQNGWYLPGICNSGGTYIGESCEINCKMGYKKRSEVEPFLCGDDLQWIPSATSKYIQEVCIRDVQNTYIKCPGNGFLDFTLPSGERYMFVKIPKPETNVDFNKYVTSYPSWGKRLETTLPAGRSDVRFTTTAPGNFNNSVSCHLVIHVIDKETPRVMGCPDNIDRTVIRGENMQIIHWREPTFYDNVGVTTVYKSREPGTEFGLGLHHITYVASDEGGNRAFCHFTINVKDELDSEVANSVIQQATYANYNNAGRYRAVLICPSGVQYMSNSPDSYNNMLTSEAGCYWRHIRVTKPMHPQNFKIPKVYSESRLPNNARANRREFFKWRR